MVVMAKVSGWLFWTPRILAILLILFLAMFSLDEFGNGYSFWQLIIGLFMHNIPSLVLLIVLIISWKHELVGAVAFIFAGLLYIASLFIGKHFEGFMISWILIISGPAFLVGILFYMNWKKKNKRKR